MLTLNRKVGQSIMINDNIRVMVVSVDRRGHVKLGFEAPKEVAIWRQELLSRPCRDCGEKHQHCRCGGGE